MTTVKEYAEDHKTDAGNIIKEMYRLGQPVTLNQELSLAQITDLNRQKPWPTRSFVKKKPAAYSSRTADKFAVRLLDDMRARISAIAERKHRSMNSQVVLWLEKCLEIEEENPNGVSKEALLEAFAELDDKQSIIVPYTHPNFTPAPGTPVRVKSDGGVWVVNRYIVRDGIVKVMLECFLDDSNNIALLDVCLDQLEPV